MKLWSTLYYRDEYPAVSSSLHHINSLAKISAACTGKLSSSRLSWNRGLRLGLIVLHTWMNRKKTKKKTHSIRTSFVIITIWKKKRTYSDMWGNLTHSSAASAVRLLNSSANKNGRRPGIRVSWGIDKCYHYYYCFQQWLWTLLFSH